MGNNPEVAEIEDFYVRRGDDGKRIPKRKYVESIEKSIYVKQPTWGDSKEFISDFGLGDTDAAAVDSELIVKHFKKLIESPDLSSLTPDKLEEMWGGRPTQEVIDILTDMYGVSQEGEESEEDEEDEEGKPSEVERKKDESGS